MLNKVFGPFFSKYMCPCVQEHCMNIYNLDGTEKKYSVKPLVLDDRLVWEYFMAVKSPYHDDVNGIRTCLIKTKD